MQQALALAAASLLSTAAQAHDGHGLSGSHWHATDFAGFGLVAVLAGLVLWLSRGK